jgi:hypothetical protein
MWGARIWYDAKATISDANSYVVVAVRYEFALPRNCLPYRRRIAFVVPPDGPVQR